MKSFFLKGLFDDEACVDFRQRTRRIILAMGKTQRNIDSLVNFFNQIKKILKELGIESNRICLQKKYDNKVILRFCISTKTNLENFRKNIGFTHPKRSRILSDFLGSYKDIHENRKDIIGVIDKKKLITTAQISRLTGLNRPLVYSHLKRLENEGLVEKKINYEGLTIWNMRD